MENKRLFIDKLGKKLIAFKKSGGVILHYGIPVEEIKQEGFGDNFGLTMDNIVLYDHDKGFDNGYHTPISKLKSAFKKEITLIRPENIQKLTFD